MILASRNFESIFAYLGCLRNGLIPLVLSSDLDRKQISKFVKQFDPRLIFAPSEVNLPSFRPIKEWGNAVLHEASDPKPRVFPDDLALLQPTSGSTGEPKCVRVSYKNIVASSAAISDYLRMDSGRVLISSLPLHYTYGLSLLHISLFAGADFVVTGKSITDRDFWRSFQAHHVSDFSGVPFHFDSLHKIGFPASVFKSLKCVTQAGGFLAPEKTRWWLDYLQPRGISYFTMYGQTEATPRISFVPPNMALAKLGSVGIAIPGGRIEIINPDDRGIGEITYYGPNVALGYAYDAEGSGRADDFLGTLHTGDLGYLDEDRFLFLTGRKNRFLKVSGVKVNLDGVEKAVSERGIVAAAIGAEDRLVVVCQGEAEETVGSLICSNFGLPGSMVRVHFLESLPRLESGKISYKLLEKDFLVDV